MKYLMLRVEEDSFDWNWDLKELIRANHMDLHMSYEDKFPEGETMSWWEHGNMTCTRLWVLILIHVSFRSKVECLCVVSVNFWHEWCEIWDEIIIDT